MITMCNSNQIQLQILGINSNIAESLNHTGRVELEEVLVPIFGGGNLVLVGILGNHDAPATGGKTRDGGVQRGQ